MFESIRMDSREVIVVSHQDALLRKRKSEMIVIIRAQQTGFDGCRDIDSTPSQSRGHGARIVFIKMKPNRHARPCRLVSWIASKDSPP